MSSSVATSLALASVAITACTGSAATTIDSIAVKVAVVEKASVATASHYSAQIVPATRLDLAFKVGGYVDSITMVTGIDGKPRPLQGGDIVHAGMQLATIRRSEYVAQLAESQAGYAQSIAGFDQADLDYQRSAKLADENAITGAEVDTARSRRRGAIAGSSGAKARRDRAATALADTMLKSPLDGVVMERSIEIGTLAAPGTIAFSVADVNRVKASFGVPDGVLTRLHIGDTETITTDTYPGVKFEGRVSYIAVSADPRTRVFSVDVTIPNDDGRLRPGSVVSLMLEAAGPEAAQPLIPLAAIARSPAHADKFAVFVVDTAGDKTIVHAREVELGEYLGRVIPVKSGLVGGERIVVQGTGLLSEGQLVEVIP